MKIDQPSLESSKVMMAKLKGVHERVTSRAINRSLVTVRAAAISNIYNEVNLTMTRIRDTFEIFRASYARPSGGVSSKAKPTPLSYFTGVRQLAAGKGVSVRILRRGDLERFRHAFIAKMPSGHIGVFEREEWFNRPWSPTRNYARLEKRWKLPIDQLFSLRVTDVFAKEYVLKTTVDVGSDTYLKNFVHELDYELGLL